MKLSKAEFKKKLESKTLSLALIGMSNCGKSHWSKSLADTGFKRYCCDDIIEKSLLKLNNSSVSKGIKAVAEWLGQPFEAGYNERADLYLKLEKESLETIFAQTGTSDTSNCVIDTTGSFVFCEKESCLKLKTSSVIFYIKTEKEEIKKLYENYLKNPKPVIWKDLYFEPLEKSYKALLMTRKELYEQYADYALQSTYLKKLTTGKQLLEYIYEIL